MKIQELNYKIKSTLRKIRDTVNSQGYRKPAIIIPAISIIVTSISIYIQIFDPFSTTNSKITKSVPTTSIVVISTSSIKEAINCAKGLMKKGYLRVKVFLAYNGLYAVSVGPFFYKEAIVLKKILIEEGFIRKDSFLASVIPSNKIHFETDKKRGLYHIIAHSTPSLQESKFLLSKYKKKELDPEIYLTSNGFYAISVGKYPRDEAIRMKDYLRGSGKIKMNSFVVSKGILKKINLPQGDIHEKFYIIVESLEYRNDAISSARKYISEGFPAEVYPTASKLFAVTIGHYPYNKAKTILRNAKKKNLIRNDAHLTTDDNFGSKIDLNLKDKLYYISVGSFLIKENAITRGNLFKDNGFDPKSFILMKGDRVYYVIGIGPYERKEKALSFRDYIVYKKLVDEVFVTTNEDLVKVDISAIVPVSAMPKIDRLKHVKSEIE